MPVPPDALQTTGGLTTVGLVPFLRQVHVPELGVAVTGTGVVALAVFDCAEVLPALSYAATAYEYVVPPASPVSL